MTDAPEDPSPAPRRKRLFRRGDFEARAHDLEEDFKTQVAATRAQIDAANEQIVKRTGRNLPAAIGIGVGLGALLIVSLFVNKAFFMVFGGALVGFTSFELASALRFSGRDISRIATVIAALATVPAAFYLGDQGKWLVTLGGILFVALWRTVELARPGHRKGALAFWADVGAGTLIQVYVPFLGSFAVLLTAQPRGEWWTLGFLLLVVLVDIGAYVSGLLFGKHPMAPRISPKKTWEGFAGAVLFSLVAGVLIALFMLQEPWWFGLIFAVVMLFTATIGDLIESLIKRDLGVKDISSWLPGHGGFLDRLDSILPSAAAAYILFVIVQR